MGHLLLQIGLSFVGLVLGGAFVILCLALGAGRAR